MKKKVISILLCMLMALSLLPTMDVYAKDTVTIMVCVDKEVVEPGDAVNFTISVGKVTNLASLQLEWELPEGMSYVSRKLYKDVIDPIMTEGMSEDDKSVYNSILGEKNGIYQIMVFGGDGTAEDGFKVAAFSCIAEKAGKTQLEFKKIVLGNTYNERLDYIVDSQPVSVIVPVTGLTIEPTEIAMETKDQIKKIEAVVLPENATNQKVVYLSSDETVATVDETGVVTAIANGKATITVRTEDGDFTKTCEVTVDIVHRHTLVAHEAKEATTESIGNIAYWECSDCKKLFSDAEGRTEIKLEDTVIPKLKKEQAKLTIVEMGAKTYGDETFRLSVTGGNGTGDVTYKSSDETILGIEGDTATIRKAGEVTITATKAGDEDYKEASAEYELHIEKKVLTITAEDKTVTRDGRMPELSLTVEGLVAGDFYTDAVLETTAEDSSKLGEYEILVSGGNLTNAESYEVSYVKGKLTVKEKEVQEKLVFAEVGVKTYGDADFELAVTGGSGAGQVSYKSSDETILGIEGNIATIRKAGEVTITALKAEDEDYLEADAELELIIAKKTLMVTADNKLAGADRIVPTLTYKVEGLVAGDIFVEPIIAHDAPEAAEVGEYHITIEGGTLTNADSYDVKYIPGILIINDKKTQETLVLVDYGNKTYGDEAFELEVTGGSGTGEVSCASSNESIVRIEDGKAVIHKAGIVTITVVKAADDEYNEAMATAELVVVKKLLTVTADDKSVKSGDSMPALTFSVSGLVNGDRFENPVLETAAKDTSAAGTYEILVSGGTLTNEESYDVSYVKGTLIITAKEHLVEPAPFEPAVPSQPTVAKPEITTRPDGTVVEKLTEITKDGGTKETVKETASDGSSVETTVEKNTSGEVVRTHEIVTKTDGTSTEKLTDGVTGAVVTVQKDAEGEIKSAKAVVSNMAEDNQTTLSAAVVAQALEASGGGNVELTMKVLGDDGSLSYKVKANTADLQKGNKLYAYRYNAKTGKYRMVNAKIYKVKEGGAVTVSMNGKGKYELVEKQTAKRINQAIKETIVPRDAVLALHEGERADFVLESGVNRKNIKRITYTSSDQAVATVDKKGGIAARNGGTVTIKAKVTLKNGATKTIQMTLTVK